MRNYLVGAWDWIREKALDFSTFVREEREKVAVAAVVLILLLFVGGIAFAWWYSNRPDPELEKIFTLREQIDNETNPEKRRELMQQMFQTMRNLNEEQRTILWAEMEENNRFNDRLREFFSLPYEQRIKRIDEDIDRMLERRRQWEQRMQQGGFGGSRGPRGGGASGAPFGGKPGVRPPGGPNGRGPQAGPFGQPGQRRVLSSEERDRLRRLYLDHTSPEMRAMRSEYRRLLQERMQQRGITFSGGRGFPGPRR